MKLSSTNRSLSKAQHDALSVPVQYVKGVGPRRAELLGKLGIRTVSDLLSFFPRAYEDRRQCVSLAQLKPGLTQSVAGEVVTQNLQKLRGGRTLFQAILTDGTGFLYAKWFNQPYVADRVTQGQHLVLSGRVRRGKGGALEINSPDFALQEAADEGSTEFGRIIPVYALTEGLSPQAMRKFVRHALDLFGSRVEENLSDMLLGKRGLPGRLQAIEQMHFPSSWAMLKAARKRCVYEELLFFHAAITLSRQWVSRSCSAPAHRRGGVLVARYLGRLSFELTHCQRRVLGELYRDMGRGEPMSRLLQGDVGSGKTVVAVCALLHSLENGYQGAFMAPTEVLAFQHFRQVSRLVDSLGVRVELLTGGDRASQRAQKVEKIRSGEAQIVVGTHALIQSGVQFSSLGLVVVDEQHKFGVVQRTQLRRKGTSPHMLVMTATPIPRSLALTLYGDLDLSVLDEMPPGRRQIVTRCVENRQLDQVYRFIRDAVDKGGAAYIVYPLVEESEKMDLKAATEMYEHLRRTVFHGIPCGLVHGRMSSSQREQVMDDFSAGRVRILFATTVIEVGIDVPSATVMLIEHAERFGLAQLHQLRGRIGRGSQQAYCILHGQPSTEEARRRLEAVRDTADGFRIAEVDLELRGPGEVLGFRQHGLPELRIANLVRDREELSWAREDAEKLITEDPKLALPENRGIKQALRTQYREKLKYYPGLTAN